LNASKSKEQASTTLAELPGKNDQKHVFIQADIGILDQVSSMMDQIDKKYNRLDILINNAAVTEFIEHSKLNDLNTDLLDRIYKVNFRGAFLCQLSSQT